MTDLEKLKAARDAARLAYDAAWNALTTALNPRAAYHAALATRDARYAIFSAVAAADQAYTAAIAAQEQETPQ